MECIGQIRWFKIVFTEYERYYYFLSFRVNNDDVNHSTRRQIGIPTQSCAFNAFIIRGIRQGVCSERSISRIVLAHCAHFATTLLALRIKNDSSSRATIVLEFFSSHRYHDKRRKTRNRTSSDNTDGFPIRFHHGCRHPQPILNFNLSEMLANHAFVEEHHALNFFLNSTSSDTVL